MTQTQTRGQRLSPEAGRSEDAVAGVQQIIKSIYAGGVPRQTLELVHIRASQINGCNACIATGIKTAASAGDVTGDLASDEGIDAAVDGVEIIVHCAGRAKGDDDKARHLVRAVGRAGSRPHLAYISVVGADRVPVVSRTDRAIFGYFASKRAAEEVVVDS